MGSGGRRQAPEPRVPGSLRAGVSGETRRLLLMQHNSPGSLPFSHNKHTAKSLASCFDEATCISPFSVYRKLLLKKVILVFTARVKGPGRLPSLPSGLWGHGRVPAGRRGAGDSAGGTRAGTPRGGFSPRDKLCLPFGKAFPAQRGALLVRAAPTSRSGFCLVVCFQKSRNPISSSMELAPLESKQCVFTSVFPGFLLIFFLF